MSENTNEKEEQAVSGVRKANRAVINNPGHSVTGAIVGTILIPIPVVGTVVGAYVGGWIGMKNDPEQNK
jgi:phage tail tape-measure protein